MRRDQLSARCLPLLGEVTRFARWLTGSDTDADDLVQDAVTRALEHAESLADPQRLRAWLFQITRNAWLDHRRAAATRERLVVLGGGLVELAEVEHPTGELPATLERHDLERALATLPEHARTALLLADLWGLAQDEIALVLDVPVGTVKSRVARARARLLLALAGDPAPPLDATARRP